MDGTKKKEKANDKKSALCELDFCVPCITISLSYLKLAGSFNQAVN